jgi:hypothetical protein
MYHIPRETFGNTIQLMEKPGDCRIKPTNQPKKKKKKRETFDKALNHPAIESFDIPGC